MCNCGCGLALAMAEAQQQEHAACCDAGGKPVEQDNAGRRARGWEALKQTLRTALGAHASRRAAAAA